VRLPPIPIWILNVSRPTEKVVIWALGMITPLSFGLLVLNGDGPRH